ncbi:TPA: hypothetical protein ACP31N_002299 [Pseudomonas aeruginosa]|uniref:hypothetical protein n=1 Tax=Pseudomonas aeruginosa TaxID=287 RepID=UPI0022EBFF48|nr:hypothetical protein [Pseudomonas aeruginosa]HBP0405270.1 hypothetical protein [Pseudomonas aeruginosa]HCE3929160.1 hypothetical protein [Pseudomonas aeruginosa]HCE3931616.1 hypothetical protein [Pseudomonas aeruginosa]
MATTLLVGAILATAGLSIKRQGYFDPPCYGPSTLNRWILGLLQEDYAIIFALEDLPIPFNA